MNKFPKSERLHSKKLIEELFKQGTSFSIYPFKVIYLQKPREPLSQNQVLVSIPKKKFKRAVDRNKLKRRIKEAYRLHKGVFTGREQSFYLLIGYIYIGKEIAEYQLIEEKLKQSLLRLTKIIDG